MNEPFRNQENLIPEKILERIPVAMFLSVININRVYFLKRGKEARVHTNPGINLRRRSN